MGKNSFILMLLAYIFFTSCECPHEVNKRILFTEDQRKWFSQAPNSDSNITVISDQPLNRYYKCIKGQPKKIEQEVSAPNGKCNTFTETESYIVEYRENANTAWTFRLSTNNGSYEFLINYRNPALNGLVMTFFLNLENPAEIKSTSYFSASEVHIPGGLRFIGDTIINNKSYNDVYAMAISLDSRAQPLDTDKFYLSVTKGLLGFHTFNGVNWLLNLN